MKRVILIGFTLVLGLLVLNVHAKADQVLEKEYQESFEVNENAKLVVENKYGDVFLTSWDKNEIKIDAIVKVEYNSKKSRISKYFENIEVVISGDEDLVKAVTHIPSMGWSGNTQVNIDYHISLPATIKLDVQQKYGNVILNNNWTGETSFDVKYGNLQTRALGSHFNDVEIAYGEMIAGNIAGSKIDIAYSDLTIKSVKTLDLKTSYSDISLGTLGDLELNSGFDDITIKEVNDMFARTNYSDVEIDKLHHSLEIDLDYGDISIDDVVPGFKFIKIDSDNAGVEIDMDESASYSLEVYTHYGDFYARESKSISKEKRSFSSYKYTGTVGTSKAGGKIFIDSNYASIEIK